MQTWSRGLRERTLQALAGLGLILALAVMGAVFMSSAVQGDSRSDEYSLTSAGSDASSVASEAKRTDLDGSSSGPSAIGILLGVLVLGTGVTVLALGARRPQRDNDAQEMLPAE